MADALTTREVAELAEVPVRAIDKAIEEKVLTGVRQIRRHGKLRRLLPMHAVSYAAITGRLSVKLSLGEKRKLARELAARAPSQMTKPLEIARGLSIDTVRLIGSDPAERAARYVRARAEHIEEDPEILGGTPVIRGTRLSVYAVRGRLDGGDSVEDILDDYPHLTRDAIEIAALYAKSNPMVGRPLARPWKTAA